ncbi:hypothetical protein [Runella sp.]|uniref:hypothetical protein n=1 Tax=Runella sp. TaxID=1960881 RepID=UPI003D0FAEA0
MNYEVTEFMRFLARFIAAIFQIMQDGKVNLKDIPVVFRVIPVIKPAFDNLEGVWDGFRNLTSDQRETLTHLVADEMDMELTPRTRALCEQVIKTATSLIETIVAFKDFRMVSEAVG